jgi:polynucleotide 5'-kinase involved in rRNA processing
MRRCLNWEEALKQITKESPRIILLLGSLDVGKTTFCLNLVSRFLEKRERVAVVDSDLGQSTFGPPTTIGLVIFNSCHKGLTSDSLREVSASHLYFIGNNSPRGHMLETVVGTKKMVDKAIENGCESVIIDTSGMISYPLGAALKYYKINLTSPDCVVALQRVNELSLILKSINGYGSLKILEVAVSTKARKISRLERIELREKGYQRYFLHSNTIKIKISSILLYPSAVDFTKDNLLDLVVGLKDNMGEFLGLGILRDFSIDEQSLSILTPVAEASKVKGLVLGRIRVGPSGRELGRTNLTTFSNGGEYNFFSQ